MKNSDKTIITVNGWEICEEDDNLIMDDFLKEDNNSFINDYSYNFVDTLSIIKLYDPMQYESEVNKVRSCMVVVKKEEGKFKAFEITSTEDKKEANKLPLNSYKKYRLNKIGYINYGHFINAKKEDIGRYLNVDLSDSDVQKLYVELLTQYDQLIRHGFKNEEDKKDLDNFIQYLKNKLTI